MTQKISYHFQNEFNKVATLVSSPSKVYFYIICSSWPKPKPKLKVNITSNLHWGKHVDAICNKACLLNPWPF